MTQGMAAPGAVQGPDERLLNISGPAYIATVGSKGNLLHER